MIEILHAIGQGLRYPCYIVLLLLMAVAVIEVGFVIYEAAQRAGSDKVNTVELLHAMRSKTPDAIRAMLDDELFLNRQKLVFSKLLSTADLPEETRLAAAKRMLEGEEDYYHRVVRITDQAGPHVRPAGHADPPRSRRGGPGTWRHRHAVPVHEHCL